MPGKHILRMNHNIENMLGMYSNDSHSHESMSVQLLCKALYLGKVLSRNMNFNVHLLDFLAIADLAVQLFPRDTQRTSCISKYF